MRKIMCTPCVAVLTVLFLLTGCFTAVPYSDSTKEAVVDARIVGSWRSEFCTGQIAALEAKAYRIDFVLRDDAAEPSSDKPSEYMITAEGNLYGYGDYLVGQFRIARFELGYGAAVKTYKTCEECQNRYIIGVIEALRDDAFIFHWLPDTAFKVGTDQELTPDIIRRRTAALIDERDNGPLWGEPLSFTRE